MYLVLGRKSWRLNSGGERVEEAGLGSLPLHAWSSPYKDLRGNQ